MPGGNPASFRERISRDLEINAQIQEKKNHRMSGEGEVATEEGMQEFDALPVRVVARARPLVPSETIHSSRSCVAFDKGESQTGHMGRREERGNWRVETSF